MTVKEIKEAIDQGKIYFGIKQTLKHVKNLSNVFITKDARDETVETLDAAGIEFIVLKSKADLSKELNLDFGCEVFSIVSKERSQVKTKK